MNRSGSVGGTRRAFFRRVALGFCGTCARVHAAPADPRQRAAEFLRKQQAADGAWRSHRYGPLREGDALTPLVLWAAPELGGSGLRWLRALTARVAAAEPWVGLAYPLFTAAYAARALTAADDRAGAKAWRGVLERLRIQPELGWPASSAACGAWGDAPAPPRLPPGLEPRRKCWRRISPRRCWRCSPEWRAIRPAPSWSDARTSRTTAASFSRQAIPVRNKAGVANRDAAGHEQYHSYGSATCDGVLALHATGVPLDAPASAGGAALAAAPRPRRRARRHVGARPRECARRAALLLCAGVCGGAAFGRRAPELRVWAREQQRALRTELLAAQQADGSWVNAYDGSFEDDPLIATAFATRALRVLPESSS